MILISLVLLTDRRAPWIWLHLGFLNMVIDLSRFTCASWDWILSCVSLPWWFPVDNFEAGNLLGRAADRTGDFPPFLSRILANIFSTRNSVVAVKRTCNQNFKAHAIRSATWKKMPMIYCKVLIEWVPTIVIVLKRCDKVFESICNDLIKRLLAWLKRMIASYVLPHALK